ncbi:MAG: glutamate--cysteine ligase, partial [Casimicrobium sp.]
LPSARILSTMANDFNNSFVGFLRAQSTSTQAHLLGLPFTSEQRARYEAMTKESVAAQKRIEAADSVPFETYRQSYVSFDRLRV